MQKVKKAEKRVGAKIDLRLVDYETEKHLPKKDIERLSDLFFILLTLYKGEELNIPITSGILIKTLFNTELELSRDNFGFLNTKFYVYNEGPFNKQFYNYFDELDEAGLLTKDNYNLSLTTRAMSLLQPLIEEFRNGKECIILDRTLEKNIKKCKKFYKAVDASHSLKALDETTKKIRTIQDVVDNLGKEKLKCIEPMDKAKKKLVLSHKITNGLLKIEAGVTESDYKESSSFSDIDQLFENVSKY